MRKKRYLLFMTMMSVAMLAGCQKEDSTSQIDSNNVFQSEVKTTISTTEVPKTEETQTVEVTTEENKVTDQSESTTTIEGFLAGNGTVILDGEWYDSQMNNIDGKKLTYDEFITFGSTNLFGDVNDAQVSYSTFERQGTKYLLMKFTGLDLYSLGDDSYTVFILVEKPDGLYLTHSESDWARRGFDIDTQGLITSGGSNGAGDYGAYCYYLDKEGKAQLIYKAETCFPGWIRSMTEYFKEDMFSDASLDAASRIDEECKEENCITFYELGGKVYAVLMIENTELFGTYEEATKKDGLIWISQEEIDQLIIETKEKLGFKVDGDNELVWTTIK